MKTMKTFGLMLGAFGMLLCASCSTTAGFGEDLQKVGGKVERRAEATGGTAH